MSTKSAEVAKLDNFGTSPNGHANNWSDIAVQNLEGKLPMVRQQDNPNILEANLYLDVNHFVCRAQRYFDRRQAEKKGQEFQWYPCF